MLSVLWRRITPP